MSEQDLSRNRTEIPSRALTVIASAPEAAPRRTVTTPADAAFLTQLLACAQSLPAYRRNRREEPSVATRSYRAALALA